MTKSLQPSYLKEKKIVPKKSKNNGELETFSSFLVIGQRGFCGFVKTPGHEYRAVARLGSWLPGHDWDVFACSPSVVITTEKISNVDSIG